MGIKNKPQDEESGTLTIYIPNIEAAAEYGATRNDEFRNTRATFDAEEGKINKLWLLAYPDGSSQNEAETKITQLTLSENKLETSYKEATVSGFKKGKYHIYLVANLEDYLENNTTLSNINEDDLLSLILKFSTNNFLEKGNLPMACLNTEVKISENTPVQEGVFEIKDTGNTLYADLTFLCAKVRYTILYDATDFSKNFESSDPDFSSALVENIIPTTSLTQPVGETIYTDEPFSKSAGLSKVAYPEANSPYFDIVNAQDAPPVLEPLETGFNEGTTKRAWQGIVYLPENITSEDNKGNRTKISVNSAAGKTEMEDSYSFSTRNLERGKVYDMVAKLSLGEVEELETTVRIEDWALETLSYVLHGQFELIVEATKMQIQSGYYSTLGYYTDSHLSFDFPTINYEGREIPFYVAQPIIEGLRDEEGNPITDEDGNPYVFNDEFDTHFRITINPEIPFIVLFNLHHEKDTKYNGVGTGGYNNGTKIYTNDDVNYFHVVAGNLHKKIEVEYDLAAFLIVTPKIITIDTREYYASGTEFNTIPISFRTNYNNYSDGVDFKLTGPASIFTGMGEMGENHYFDLILESDKIDKDTSDEKEETYLIGVSEGVLYLRVNNIFKGHEFWNEEQTYELTFTLNVMDPNNPNDSKPLRILEEKVIIIIKPFTTNYIIHFRDNTKEWKAPHIFVYQDLTLPSDLTSGRNRKGDDVNATDYADKIVGYVEYNNGQQWNAATQYVFSNNISFKGWAGYGGPEVNNPYDIYTNSLNNSSYDRMGFVMFGTPRDTTVNNQRYWIWNDDYGYTNRTDSKVRHARYRYDVNFNEDHEKRITNYNQWWNCENCKINHDAGSKYAGTNDDGYDYPGILMEYEGDGWWKYTLTGVATPGKTMMSFADTHEPWEKETSYRDYAVEDFRFPPEYESGLQLFDFVDNEGWFLFDGNTSNTNQNFSATKPTNVIPHQFTSDLASNMRIEFEKPDNFSNIEIYSPDNEWSALATYTDINQSGNTYYIDINTSNIEGLSNIQVKINTSDWNSHTYELATKNFVNKNGKYVLADRLRLKFENGMKLFIKWNDDIFIGDPGKWSYQPQHSSDFLNIYKDGVSDSNLIKSSPRNSKKIGNYKIVDLSLDNIYNNDKISSLILELSETRETNYTNATRNLNIQDLPKFYNPSTGKYHINWHMLEPMRWQ